MASSKNPYGESRDDNELDAAINKKMHRFAFLDPAASVNEMVGNGAFLEVYYLRESGGRKGTRS
jgi:hypothetical protein